MIDDDAVLIAIDPISRTEVAAAVGTVEIYPGIKVTFDKPGIFNSDGKLISREVTHQEGAQGDA